MNLYISDNYSFQETVKMKQIRYKSSNLTVIYCSGGSATYKVGKETYEIEKDCFLAIPHDVEFSRTESSDDYRMDTFQFGKDIVIRITDEISRNLLDYFIWFCPIQKIEGHRAEMAFYIIRYVKELFKDKESAYNGHIIMEYFKILLYEVCNNVLAQMSNLNRHTHSYTIWREFTELLKRNFKEHHDVLWYAGQMNISPKHLHKVISSVTQESPSKWINETIVNEAMRQLRETDRPVKEIAYDLNFSSPSHFISFFKRIVEITPKDYRENLYTLYDKKDSPIKYEIIREQGIVPPNLAYTKVKP